MRAYAELGTTQGLGYYAMVYYLKEVSLRITNIWPRSTFTQFTAPHHSVTEMLAWYRIYICDSRMRTILLCGRILGL